MGKVLVTLSNAILGNSGQFWAILGNSRATKKKNPKKTKKTPQNCKCVTGIKAIVNMVSHRCVCACACACKCVCVYVCLPDEDASIFCLSNWSHAMRPTSKVAVAMGKKS